MVWIWRGSLVVDGMGEWGRRVWKKGWDRGAGTEKVRGFLRVGVSWWWIDWLEWDGGEDV
jgi:hypothetical protein